MFEGVDEIPYNVCGVIGNRYLIAGPVDEPVEKAFMYFHVYDEYPQREKELYFGSEGQQEAENDPEYGGRPFAIIKYDATVVSVLSVLSPQKTVPTVLALMIGLGCVRALAALNRAGFVHRFVTPFNFAITNPLTKKNVLEKMIIIDFSAVMPWPCNSVRAHWGREQGPSDDIISVIYMVAEMLHGKLPWRSLNDDEDRICFMKTYFYKTNAFKKLPRQLRQIYREMLSRTGSAPVEFKSVIELFQKAIENRDRNDEFQMPEWFRFYGSSTD